MRLIVQCIVAMSAWALAMGCQARSTAPPATLPAMAPVQEHAAIPSTSEAEAPASAPAPRPPIAEQQARPPAREYPSTDGVHPPTGQRCIIHLRRDTLGLAAPAPLPLGQESIPGRSAQLAGVLDQVTDQWLVLRAGGKAWWIPRDVVLSVEVPTEP